MKQAEPDLDGAVLPHFLDALLRGRMGRLFANGERGYDVAHVRLFDRIPVIPDQNRTRRLGSNDAKKITRVMFIAELQGLDGVVVLIDRESKKQPDRAKRMRTGRSAFRSTGSSTGPACAVGATCRSVETWLLADSHAREEVFGEDAANPFSGDPEGRPSPRKLKKYIDDYCERQGIDRLTAQEQLAKLSRPDKLRQRCVTSYPPFADDVEAEIAPLVNPS